MENNCKALISLCQVLNVDYNLVTLASILKHSDFKKILSNFSGKTIKVPSVEELKDIDDKSSKIIESLSKESSVANAEGRALLRDILNICKSFKECSKEDLYKVVWTESLMKEFCNKYFSEGHTNENYENLSGEQLIELHKMKIKEGKIFKQILTTISELMVKKDP